MHSDNNQEAELQNAMRASVVRQIKALERLEERINGNFLEALALLTGCRGRVILFGMSQSGLIGQKIAATLYNAGLSSHLINPSDAWHDQFSMVGVGDIIIMLSYSGKTPELMRLYPGIQRMGNKVIAITGDPRGPVAEQADIVLDASVSESPEEREFAPTTYTTVLLTIGDLMTEALCRYQAVHQTALSKDQKIAWVRNVMNPSGYGTVTPDSNVGEVMQAMTSSGTKICLVMDKDSLCGIITDGDLRKRLSCVDSLGGLSAKDIMNSTPVGIRGEASVVEAKNLMEKHHIWALVVQDSGNQVIGTVTIEACN